MSTARRRALPTPSSARRSGGVPCPCRAACRRFGRRLLVRRPLDQAQAGGLAAVAAQGADAVLDARGEFALLLQGAGDRLGAADLEVEAGELLTDVLDDRALLLEVLQVDLDGNGRVDATDIQSVINGVLLDD